MNRFEITLLRSSLVTLVALSGFACGDDDGTVDTGPGDALVLDTGRDVNVPDTPMPRDVGTDAGPTYECSPFTSGGCAEGLKCSVVIDQTDPDDITVRYACVSAAMSRPAGAPCAFSVDATPGDASDTAIADTCAEGLFCSNQNGTPAIPRRCEELCLGGTDDLCSVEGSYCLLANSEPPFGVCRASADCDPVLQTGCGMGEGCIVLANDSGDLIGDCFAFEPMEGSTGEVGSRCQFIDQCLPGGTCLGEGEDRRCLQLCDASDSTKGGDAGTDAGEDAGTDAGEDAGTDAGTDAGPADAGSDAGPADAGSDAGPGFTGECPEALDCVALEAAEGRTALTPTPPGICVTPE